MHYPKFKYYEGAYSKSLDNIPIRRHIIVPATPEAIEDFRFRHKNEMCYLSTMRFKTEKAVLAKKWKGTVIGDFYVDIDTETTLQDTLTFTKKYLTELGNIVPWLYTRCYFSGMKGFHIEVPFEAFGAEPSDQLHFYWKYIARTIGESALGRKIKKGEKLVDMGRYSLRQLWRTPNTTHLKSGKFKIPLYPKELFELTLNQVLQLATIPRMIPFKQPPGLIEPAVELYQKAKQFKAGISWWFHK